jgi:glucose-6-phosphate isomerase
MDIRFDFSLVLEKNLRSGDGLTARDLRKWLRGAEKAALAVARRHAEGKIGFPDLPFLEKEARALSRDAARMRKRFTHMLVLGIGGSALGTKAVLEGIGGRRAGKGLALTVADNVDPEAFMPLLRSHPMKTTAVVAISKSGGTPETNAQLSLAADALKKANGRSWKGHLVLVTDPKNGAFRRMAEEEGIASYPVPPNVGGRFSVLSPVGLLPLAAAGVSPEKLLLGARRMENVFRTLEPEKNPVLFASAVYARYLIDAHKPVHVWMTYGHGLDRVAEWWQQLWAESLGKLRPDGKPVGQTPARAVGVTDQHSQVQLYQDGPADKVYTFVKWMKGGTGAPGAGPLRNLFEAEFEGTIGALWNAGRPIVRIEIGARDEVHMGAFLHFWEWVTAVVGECAGIDPFDQPGVEEGKKITRALMGDAGAEGLKERFLRRMKGRVPAEIRIAGND